MNSSYYYSCNQLEKVTQMGYLDSVDVFSEDDEIFDTDCKEIEHCSEPFEGPGEALY